MEKKSNFKIFYNIRSYIYIFILEYIFKHKICIIIAFYMFNLLNLVFNSSISIKCLKRTQNFKIPISK